MSEQLQLGEQDQPDPQLQAVRAELLAADPDGSRFATVLRDTYDQLLDGRRTGRYAWTQLRKTEKTHMGTVVEINLHREFAFEDGEDMDYRIAGVDVDCKFSQRSGGWMLPQESVGHLCLLVTASDEDSRFSVGLIRVTPEVLSQRLDPVTGAPTRVENRDRKGTLSKAGREKIVWLWRDAQLPPNLLLHLPEESRARVLNAASGTERLCELFRLAQGELIRRSVVETVAQQEDSLKRVRGNGGARERLASEGIVILGHRKADTAIAQALGLPIPASGQFVSARLSEQPLGGPSTVQVADAWYRLAEPGDPVTLAPQLPR